MLCVCNIFLIINTRGFPNILKLTLISADKTRMQEYRVKGSRVKEEP